MIPSIGVSKVSIDLVVLKLLDRLMRGVLTC